MNIKSLNINNTDVLASLSKGALGMIPIAGPMISEAISNIIPNQRLDRLVSYIQELDSRLHKLEDISCIQKKCVTDSPYMILIEDSLIHASRVVTDDRRKYISSLVINGLTSEEANINRYRYLLSLLSELNDEEIIWLRFFLKPYFGGDDTFRNTHANVLTPARNYFGIDAEMEDLAALQDSYKAHLERLRLIKKRLKVDSKTRMPVFDNMTGEPEGSLFITHLGKMLLKEIDLLDEE